MRAIGIGVLLAALAAASSPAPGAAQGASVALLAGRFNVGKTPAESEAGVELRLAPRIWGLRPVAGVSGNEEGAVWGWGGVARDLPLAEGWRLTPGFAVTHYDRGDSKNLGGSLQFRSSLELSYHLGGRTRAGAAIYHLSNAGIEKPNPGANSVVVTLAFDLGR